MDREILFRGKRIDTGEWIEGDLLSKCKCSPKISIDGEYNRGLFVVDSYEVIPETVGQFTGLTDKNGKKIFEGDIIWAYGSQELTVKWNEQDACFEGVFDGEKSGIPDDDNDDYAPACDFNYLEIIGNIHEEVTK